MSPIRPFAAIRFVPPTGHDISPLIAPPYDVLDEKGKAELQARHNHNIVTIDLPHLPAKTVGPDSTYASANATLQAWLSAGVLRRDPSPAFYPYTQTYNYRGRAIHRRGFFALVRLSPFGQGQVVPHEQTYKGPIEDRLKLMRASGVQLSPIFGLFNDPSNRVSSLLYSNLAQPLLSGTLDDVRNDLWRVTDGGIESQVIDLMKGTLVYIADGHHRYTTALQYQAEAKAAAGGELPDEHPANWCLFALVSMQDAGLLIHPTHRLIGGLRSFDIQKLKEKVAGAFELTELPQRGPGVADYLRDQLPQRPAHTFGLYDGQTGRLYELRLTNPDILQPLDPQRSEAWRRLDVAILQRYLLEQVIQPLFADGEVDRGYTAEPDEVAQKVDGQKYQVGLLLQSTPLRALVDLGEHNEVMPQKSTYFYPKVATGMVINPLR